MNEHNNAFSLSSLAVIVSVGEATDYRASESESLWVSQTATVNVL